LHDEFLVGVDLTFDGRSAIKLYPDVTPAELENMEIRQRLSRVLSQEALEAMSRCCWTHVYIAKQNKETVLQFHPSDPDDFVARYLPDVARSKIHAAYRGSRLLDMVVSLPESELRRVPAENFSLYYMPGDYWRLLGGAQGFGLA
jgi:LynF/TruF/PatF family peptide O-prenyltransferase